MIGLLCFVLAVLTSPFKSKLRLGAENVVLRHQLMVLKRRLHGRVRLTNHDRWFFIQLYRWVPSILQVLRSRQLQPSLHSQMLKHDGNLSAVELNDESNSPCSPISGNWRLRSSRAQQRLKPGGASRPIW